MGERSRTDDPAVGPQAGGTATQEGGMLELGRVYAILEHPRRRVILDVVADLEAVTTRDLATQVAAREQGIPPHAVTDEQRRAVTIALYHVHLPKLTDAEVLTVENGIEQIRLGPNADQVFAVSNGIATRLESTT